MVIFGIYVKFRGCNFPHHQAEAPTRPARPELPGALEKRLLVRVELAWIVPTQHNQPTTSKNPEICRLKPVISPRVSWRSEDDDDDDDDDDDAAADDDDDDDDAAADDDDDDAAAADDDDDDDDDDEFFELWLWCLRAEIWAFCQLNMLPTYVSSGHKSHQWPCFMTRSWNYALWILWNNLPQKTG